MTDRSDIDGAWGQFCGALEQAGRQILETADGDSLNAGEGLRFLLRAAGYFVSLQMDGSDTDFPRLLRSSHETLKMTSDSPDYYYMLGNISGKRTYRITGTRGEAEKLSFSTYGPSGGGIICMGDLGTPDLTIGPDGTFELIVASTPHPGNWLPMAPEASFMQVRNMFRDHRRINPARVEITCVDGPETPRLYTADVAAAALRRAAGAIAARSTHALRFREALRQRAGVNSFDHDQHFWQSGAASSVTYYVQGLYEIAADEALVVECAPPEARYFSFQINNLWLESLDYEHHRIYRSNYTSTFRPDGSVRYIIAETDPGMGDWIDTAGHPHGVMVWKWYEAVRPPQPTVRKVKISELASLG